MKECWHCKEEITDKNKSEEHIIPNAIGGRLKSSDLICKPCNGGFGSEIDKKFIDQFKVICNLIDVNRQRGKAQDITVKSEEGEYYRERKGDLKFRQPKTSLENIDEKSKKFKITGSRQKDVINALRKFQKEHPKVDVEEISSTLKRTRELVDQNTTINAPIINEETYRGALKVLINYCIQSGVEQRELNKGIQFLKGEVQDFDIKPFYAQDYKINKEVKSVLHSILIIGSKSEKILFGIAEFFNAYRYISILSDNYTGEDISKSYAYNVLTSKELIPIIEGQVSVTRSHIMDIFNQEINGDQEQAEIKALLEKCCKIANLNFSFSEVFEDVYKEAYDQLEDKTDTMEFSKLLSGMLVEKLKNF